MSCGKSVPIPRISPTRAVLARAQELAIRFVRSRHRRMVSGRPSSYSLVVRTRSGSLATIYIDQSPGSRNNQGPEPTPWLDARSPVRSGTLVGTTSHADRFDTTVWSREELRRDRARLALYRTIPIDTGSAAVRQRLVVTESVARRIGHAANSTATGLGSSRFLRVFEQTPDGLTATLAIVERRPVTNHKAIRARLVEPRPCCIACLPPRRDARGRTRCCHAAAGSVASWRRRARA